MRGLEKKETEYLPLWLKPDLAIIESPTLQENLSLPTFPDYQIMP